MVIQKGIKYKLLISNIWMLQVYKENRSGSKAIHVITISIYSAGCQ